MSDTDLIVINKQDLILARDEANNILVTPDAEEAIRKVLELKKFAEELFSFMQDKLSQVMEEQKTKKIICGNLVIRNSLYGSRYKLGVGTEEKFIKKVEYNRIDPEAVDEYIEKEGKLPEGVILADRSKSVSITTRQEAQDD